MSTKTIIVGVLAVALIYQVNKSLTHSNGAGANKFTTAYNNVVSTIFPSAPKNY